MATPDDPLQPAPASSLPASSLPAGALAPQTIALVDDDRNILTTVSIALQAEGFATRVYADGQTALRALVENPPDLAIFDIKMPRMDGLELLQRLREKSALPVIFLTSKDEEPDEALGLAMGADDYITKPFSQRLLVARIRAILRRVSAGRPVAETIKRLSFDRFRLDMGRRLLTDETGSEMTLGTAEFRLLQALVSRPGVVLNRDQLLDITAGRSAQAFDRSIDNLVSRLRRRLERDPQHPELIKTVWGDGYVFAAPVREEA